MPSPEHEHLPHPLTPDIYQICSKRSFDGQVCHVPFQTLGVYACTRNSLMACDIAAGEHCTEQLACCIQVKRWRRDLHKWDPAVGEDEEVVVVRPVSHFQHACTPHSWLISPTWRLAGCSV